ncbi:MAG: sugar-transfer associated ATP-grasp domain-containing protein [Anaerovoracaceae bacterium]
MPESNLSYKFRVFSNAKLSTMNQRIDYIHKISGKSKAWLFADMMHCARKFGSGYNDYTMYHFWELDDATRDTYLTRFRSKALINQVNDERFSHCYDNKNEFDEIFAEYEKRSFVDMTTATDDDIKKYYETHERTFGKMLDLSCGIGAESIKMSDFDTADDFVKYVREKNFGVLEDLVENHHALKEINPYALNTMRLITLIGDDGEPHLLFAAQKFGLGKRVVDVFGMHSPIDIETGVCNYPFHSGDTAADQFYTEHPITHKNVIGFKVPYWEESKEMILKASLVVPQIRYVGWDVAVTEDGPVIIEGNNYTAYDYMQLPKQSDSRIGIIPEIKKIVPSYKY